MEKLEPLTEDLDLQADQIEQALRELSMPARVNGGQVRERWVRYHLTPIAGTRICHLREAADDMARAIGVREVRVGEEAGEVSVDVPLAGERRLRLLPLIRSLGRVPPLTAVVGLTQDGRPLLLPLDSRDSWHILAVGPRGSGKSELLRTLSLSLAMTSRPAQLQMVGLDIGGRELAVLESLPHLATDLATEPVFAGQVLTWLAEEVERRLAGRPGRPEWVLVLDDLSWLGSPEQRDARACLETIVQRGPSSGVHVLATMRPGEIPDLERVLSRDFALWAEAETRPEGQGRFWFRCRSDDLMARVAWLTAADLNRAVRWIAAGWRPGRAMPAEEW